MFEFIGSVLALGLVAQIVVWVVAGLLFPLFWLWMFIDAMFRLDHEYPTAGSNGKVLWILLMAFFQLASVFYFFMVYRKIERGSVSAPTIVAAASAGPPVASAGM